MRRTLYKSIATVLALLCLSSAVWGTVDYEYWVESHAASQGLMRGDRWDYRYPEGDYPATASWEAISSGTGEFGANHTSSSSAISDDQHFAYAYADATWQDTVTIYNPSESIGSMMELYLHFSLSGGLHLYESGVQPEGTTVESRAAVSADVKSVDLGLAAHGYNMLADYGGGVLIMRQSGDWDLGGTAITPYDYVYCDEIILPALIPNGIPFDLLAKVAVATQAKISYAGDGDFPALNGFELAATADFSHTMVFGVFTDAEGREIGQLGYFIGSSGPTFGGPIVIPEPATLGLLGFGIAAAVAARRRARRS